MTTLCALFGEVERELRSEPHQRGPFLGPPSPSEGTDPEPTFVGRFGGPDWLSRGGRRGCHGASGHGRAGVPSRATGATKSVAPDTPAPVPQPGRGAFRWVAGEVGHAAPPPSRRSTWLPSGRGAPRGRRRGSHPRAASGRGRTQRLLVVRRARWWTVDQPGAVNGLRGDGAWRPSARRGRTRQAPGLAGRDSGSGSVAGMVRRAGSDALLMSLRSTVPVGSSAASIRRGSRPNTAFGFRGCFDMRNTPGSQQTAGYPTQGNTGSGS